jgi:hypothetical protein
MPNTKAVGIAYSDPQFDSIAVSGASSLGAVTATTVAATTVAAATVTTSGDAAASNAVAGVYFFSTAITANTTTTTAPKGSIGTTSNATGAGKLFISDGAKWQFAAIT